MLMPMRHGSPFDTRTWSVVSNTTGTSYPGGLQDYDIAFYVGAYDVSANTTGSSPTGFTNLLLFAQGTPPTIDSDGDEVPGSADGTRIEVGWRSVMSSTSGALGGTSSTRRLLIFRSSSPLTSAASVVTVGTQSTTQDRTYTAPFGAERSMVTPIWCYIGTGSTGTPTCTIDGASATINRAIIGGDQAGIFYAASQQAADVDFVYNSGFTSSSARKTQAVNIRFP